MSSFRLLAFIICIGAAHFAHALITSDKMPTRILKMYDKNVLVLNRGLEDGIFKGDHIKLTSEDGFIARGICLKSSLVLSHWKIYRVVRPQLVSKDTEYLLHSMNQSEIPKSLEGFREVDFSSYYNDIKDADTKKGLKLQQERIAKYDLPDSIIDAQEREKKEELSETQRFVGENFSKKLLKKDFAKVDFSIFASPISWESLNEQRNLYFGFNVRNNGKKYDLEINGEQRETRIVDRYTQEEVEKVYRHIDGSFLIKDISENWSYFTYALYEQEKQGDIYNPKAQINFGPVGFYRHFKHRNELGEEFKIGFVPMFDQRSYETLDGKSHERSNARFGFRLFYTEAITKLTSFKADFWYNPYFDLSTQEIEFDDSRTNLKAILNRKMTDHFSIEYQLQYLKDLTYQKDLGVSPENVINTINFRLSTDL